MTLNGFQELVNKILEFILLQKNILAQPSSGDRDVKLDMNLRQCPYFVYESAKGSDETALLHRLV